MAPRVAMLVISAVLGLAAALAAPRSWGVAPFHGILLGAAIYIAALRHGRDAALRAAAFLALAAAQAWVVFVAAPGADVRATFVILSTWIVLESVGGRPAEARAR
ncbi:MAG TPA: hypothetical protein VFT93_02040 [Candidatus Eisenbacteria bacterium]|nr:hypothetical protein [Candidatus Eisenbacteria bacterium]